MAKNSTLTRAKNAKRDEFYTELHDVEQELKYYKSHFRNKIVYCNCDDPTRSSFWRYFYRSFGYLGLKRLISTHYNMDGSSSYALIYEGGHDSDNDTFDVGVKRVSLKGDGDFRSPECIEYLKQSDIVVTNPMFSLFREYVATLMKYHKQFLIWGNQNAITYKEFFPLLMNRQVWIGNLANKTCVFQIPDDYKKWDKKETEKRHDGHHYAKVPAITTFTNMSLNKTTDQVTIWKHFDQADYPAYDNYAAFEVSKVADIPLDKKITAKIDADNLAGWQNTYGDDLTVLGQDGDKLEVKIEREIFGVPITFLDKYNPGSTVQTHNLAKMFDIVGADGADCFKPFKKYGKKEKVVNGIRKKSNTGRLGPCIRMSNYGYKGTLFDVGYPVKSTYKRVFIRRKK